MKLRTRRVRSQGLRAVAALLGASVAVVLAGCGNSSNQTSPSASTTVKTTASSTVSATPSKSASATPTKKTTALQSIDDIKVRGKYGSKPTVTVPSPFMVAKTQSKVLSQGSGVTVTKESVVKFNYVGMNARTGAVFDSSWATGRTPLTMPLAQLVPGFISSTAGRTVGSRVLMVINSADGYPQGGQGIEAGDSILFVIDILSATLDHPTGTAVSVPANLPQVIDVKGVPKVTIPKTSAPTKLTTQQVIKGTGDKVTANDTIVVNYAVYDWATGRQIASDYTTGKETGALSGLVPAWQKGLVGQPIGSRVLIVAPPSDAYGSKGNATPSIAPNSTLVYVIDVLYSYVPLQ